MLEIKHLSKKFGERQALLDVSARLRQGDIVCLLGPNGAGKSTLLRLVCGYLTPDSGEVLIGGSNPQTDRIEALSKIGYVQESNPLYGDMSVYEYIRYVADLWQMPTEKFESSLTDVLEHLQLREVLNQKIDTLSKGFRHRVGIAGALIHKPQILILDEPTEGLDPNQKHHVHRFIREYGKNHLIIVSTHIMEELEAMGNRVLLLHRGKLILDATPEQLKTLSPGSNDIAAAFRRLTGES